MEPGEEKLRFFNCPGHNYGPIVTIVRCVMVMYGCVGESSVSLHVVRSMITDILRPAGGHEWLVVFGRGDHVAAQRSELSGKFVLMTHQ